MLLKDIPDGKLFTVGSKGIYLRLNQCRYASVLQRTDNRPDTILCVHLTAHSELYLLPENYEAELYEE